MATINKLNIGGTAYDIVDSKSGFITSSGITLSSLLNNASTLNSTFNYDNLTTSNIYYLDGANPITATNGPFGNVNNPTNSFLFVLERGTNTNRVTQIILPGNNANIFVRSKITDTTNWHPWKRIKLSNVYEEVEGIITPAMTADNMGTWKCAASNPYSGYSAYKAFDQNTNYSSDFYHSTSTMPQWIYIGSSEKKWLPTSVEMYNGQGSSWTGRMPGTFKLQGSDDLSTWVDKATLTKSGSYSHYTWNTGIAVQYENFYKYWRMYITSSCTSDNYMNIGAINYYGYILN